MNKDDEENTKISGMIDDGGRGRAYISRGNK